jgi:hypothetical protein
MNNTTKLDLDLCKQDLEDRRKKALTDNSISEVKGEFTRRIEFEAGYDHWTDKTKWGCNHGQHGMQMKFVLTGPEGSVQWYSGFSDMVPGNVDIINNVKYRGRNGTVFSGWDLGYHWLTPQYEGQEIYRREDCPYTDTGVCYYDGSGIAGGDLVPIFLSEGPTGIWQKLEEYYNDLCNPNKLDENV